MGDEGIRNGRPDSEILGDLLRKRVQSLQDAEPKQVGAPARASNCSECGSRLSENSEFCWMCGATRSTPQLSLVPPPSGSKPGATDAVVRAFPTSTAMEDRAETVAFNLGAYSSAATAAAPEFETVAGPQPVREPALFSQFYQNSQPQPEIEGEDEEEEQPRHRFDYRIAILGVLVIALVAIGYRGRHNIKAIYDLSRQAIAEQLAQLWGPSESPAPEQQARPSQSQKRAKSQAKAIRRPPTKNLDRAATVTSSAMTAPRPSFLRVRVDGQPGPDLVSYAPRSAPPTFMGDAPGLDPHFATRSEPAPFAVTISPRESLSLLLRQVPPSYPPAARAFQAKGPVVLKALIHKDGNVGDLSVVTGSPLLTQSAIEAVRQWVYRPYYRNGEPMDVETLVVVDFPQNGFAEANGMRPRN